MEVSSQVQAPATLPPGKERPVHTEWEAGWPLEPFGHFGADMNISKILFSWDVIPCCWLRRSRRFERIMPVSSRAEKS
jgi:hypothetical protein